MKTIFILGIGAALGVGATMIVNVYMPQQAEAKPTEIVRPVSWWKDNKPERTEKVAQCNNNPGELAATSNCLNAIVADTEAAFYGNGTSQPNILDGMKTWNK